MHPKVVLSFFPLNFPEEEDLPIPEEEGSIAPEYIYVPTPEEYALFWIIIIIPSDSRRFESSCPSRRAHFTSRLVSSHSRLRRSSYSRRIISSYSEKVRTSCGDSTLCVERMWDSLHSSNLAGMSVTAKDSGSNGATNAGMEHNHDKVGGMGLDSVKYSYVIWFWSKLW